MKIEKVLTIKKTLFVPTGIGTVVDNYVCSRVLTVACEEDTCTNCVLYSKNIVDFLQHVKEQDEA